MQGIIYLRMKKHYQTTEKKKIKLRDIAHISGNETIVATLNQTVIYEIVKEDLQVCVIEGFTVIQKLQASFPELDLQLLGPNQTIIHISKKGRLPQVTFVLLVWLLLFVGSAMTIMNFHYDVSMQSVQQRLHYLFTGEEEKYPLWMQIPYSLGLGLGMILFFNHVFKKRFNEEPSPLEIEIYKYQQDIDQYVSHYENKLNDTNDK
ncbi:stage V sporulation protein AA [Paraliobacillus sediminis]|uniref:stage V sporulation protein AA n=1 Tax=Paraliobacillus sediminis TaxID=1885916 RepID=UPI000E3E38AC|nr:stage V sporulation protein AA [Paraliobacillus sediminis]